MSDRSDKDLSRHIRAVFDAYDEPYDPASWAQLQRRRRGRTATVYLKWGGAAASIAVLIAAGVLLWNSPGALEASRQAFEPQQTEIRPGDPGGELPAAGDKAAEQSSQAKVAAGPSERQEAASAQAREPETSSEAASTPVPGATQLPAGDYFTMAAGETADGGETFPVGETAAEEEVAKTGDAIPDAIPGAGIAPPVDPASTAAAAEEETQRAANVAPDEHIASSDAIPFRQAEDRVSTGDDPAADNYPAYKEEEEKNAPSGRFSVGFVTTSLMNYASGNTGSQVHFGAGITSGWKLSERLSLHSGVILAENSLSLNNSNSSVQASSYAASVASDTELSAVGKNSIVQNVSPQSMDVNLLVMDVPLNLTYRLGVGKTDLLLTGGFSSFAYLDQEYSYHNAVQLYTNATVASPEPVVRNEKAFSHFDLARQLNLAIGTEVSLGKGSVLIVEPYVKYPLGELTSENIKFGSAGMNLRLSFQTGN